MTGVGDGEVERVAQWPSRCRSLGLFAFVGSLLALTAAGCGAQRQVGVSIEVDGKREFLPPGTTLAQAASLLGIRPASGSLLDVGGRVLRRGVYPGSLLLDDQRAPGATRLREGDRIVVVRGRSRTEALSREVIASRGGALGNPEFTLARTPGVSVVVRGAVSHELVSAHFRPTGRLPTVERSVALTFDDGPWPQNTPRILRVLRRAHAPATFFVIGYLAASYPDLVALEHRDGMAIGNHSYNHPQVPPFGQLPPQLIRDEIGLAADSLARIGVHPHLFRPPGGSYSATLIRTAGTLGERVVLWSVDPSDWSPGVTARQIVSRVLAAVRPGSIVILHDGGGDRTATIRALPAIIKGIRKRGLRLVKLTDAPADGLSP
jgi:peptidoglycan/xylan/chitin deacetylase (PgdA/CDA1 family)